MATTKIWNVSKRTAPLLDYCANPEKTKVDSDIKPTLEYAADNGKTERCLYVSGVNCAPKTAAQEFQLTKQRFSKPSGVLAYHAIQSFAEGEVTPAEAHEIGVKLAQQMWGEHFEVQVATHLNTDNIHNHFVLNSVSFVDGRKYNDCKATYRQLRDLSDRLCREKGLSVVVQPNGRGKQYAEWKAEQDGKPTWRSLVREDVDRAIAASMSFTQFIRALEKEGYVVKTGVKYMAVRPPGKERFVRLYGLGEGYSEDEIKKRILGQQSVQKPKAAPPKRTSNMQMRGRYGSRKKLTGFRALYFSYLYKMGIISKAPKRVPFLIREDVRKMENISAEIRLLCTTHIDTVDQLTDHRADTDARLKSIYTHRKKLTNQLRRCSEPSVSEIKLQISALTAQAKKLRKEVFLCDEILERSRSMESKLAAVFQTAQKKELNQHERTSGSDRIDVPKRH